MKTVTTSDVLVAMLLTFAIGQYVGRTWAAFDWNERYLNEIKDHFVRRDRVLLLLENRSFEQAKQAQTEYLRQAVEQAMHVPDLPDKFKPIVERRKSLLTP